MPEVANDELTAKLAKCTEDRMLSVASAPFCVYSPSMEGPRRRSTPSLPSLLFFVVNVLVRTHRHQSGAFHFSAFSSSVCVCGPRGNTISRHLVGGDDGQ